MVWLRKEPPVEDPFPPHVRHSVHSTCTINSWPALRFWEKITYTILLDIFPNDLVLTKQLTYFSQKIMLLMQLKKGTIWKMPFLCLRLTSRR